jgi:rhamnosyltransferase
MKIEAILVLYNVRTDDTVKALGRLMPQVDRTLLVDNSSTSAADAFREMPGVEYIALMENRGIAAAQNTGIERALADGADYVLLADPDSNIPSDAVSRLLATSQYLEERGIEVGGVGSRAINAQDGKPIGDAISVIGKLPATGAGRNLTEVAYIMNSISLIPTRLFAQAGMMDETLFIDGVDSEWCWRVKANTGARFFVDENVLIGHHLGIGDRHLLGRTISVPAPMRTYYQYRNYLWLRRRSYVPHAWIAYNGKKYIAKVFVYCLLVAPRMHYLKCICKGVRDGLKKQTI